MKAGVNRIKSLSHSPIVALWNENGDFGVYDLTAKFDYLLNLVKDDKNTVPLHNKNNNNNSKKKDKGNNELVRLFKNNEEGFGLDWSGVNKYRLASGSVDNKIYIYECRENLQDISR